MSEQAWQDIESAPKDGTKLLLVFTSGIGQVVDIGFWAGNHWMYQRSQSPRFDKLHQPTAWLPLPPPSGEANSK